MLGLTVPPSLLARARVRRLRKAHVWRPQSGPVISPSPSRGMSAFWRCCYLENTSSREP
jgi:hypothetical protein